MENILSKSECSKLKEQILREEVKLDLFTEAELEIFTDYLLETLDPDSVSETNLLEQCYKALSVYTHTEEHLPSACYGEMAESVIKTFEPERKCLSPRKVIILVAAIITILALTGCSIIGLVLFDVISLGKTLLNIDENTSVCQGNKEIERTDEYIQYDSVEEMINEQRFPKLYPSKIPKEYGLKLAEILLWDNERQVNILCENNEDMIVFIAIEDYSKEVIGERISIGELDVYIDTIGNNIQACFSYDGDFYSIQCSDMDLLLELINCLEEY